MLAPVHPMTARADEVRPNGLELLHPRDGSFVRLTLGTLRDATGAWLASGAASGVVALPGEVGDPASVLPAGGGLLVTQAAVRASASSPTAASLLASVDAALERIGAKAHTVLAMRLASDDDDETARAIHRRLGMGAQRTEEVEAEALDAVDGLTGCLGPVRQSLADLRDALPRPLQALRAEPWAEGLGEAALRRLCAGLAGLHAVEIPGEGAHLVPFGPDVWADALAELDRVTRGHGRKGVAETSEQVAERLDQPLEARAACARALRLLLRRDSPVRGLVAAGRWDLVVDALLPPDGGSLGFHQVLATFEAALPGLLDERATRRLLDRHAIELTGDRYVSVKGPEVDDPAARGVAHRCATLAANHKDGGPVTTAWLLSRLADGRVPVPPCLAEAGLARILLARGTLRRTGVQEWRSPPAAGPGAPPEAQAEAALVRNGGPMRARTLASRLPGRRAFRDDEWAKGRVTLLGRGFAGLVDRDLPIDARECRDVAEMAQELVAGGRGATLDDLMLALADRPYGDRLPDPADVAGLVQSLGGVSVDRHGLLRDALSPAGPLAAVAERTVRALLDADPDGITTRAAMDAVRGAAGGGFAAGATAQALGKLANRDRDDPDAWRPATARELGARARTRPERPARPAFRSYPLRRKPAERTEHYDWTPERVEILLRLAAQKAGSRRIRAALGGGISKNAVVSKAFRLGVTVA